MKKPPVRPDEAARLDELRRFNILDTLPEQVYDDLVFMASQICQTPISTITLIDENRHWFKASEGLGDATTAARDTGFCGHAIVNPEEIMIVGDTSKDDRFFDNPSVTGAPKVRFYAGAPLVTSKGYPLGTLCVCDVVPRELSKDQLEALKSLARQVMRTMEAQQMYEETQLESIRMKTLVSSMTSGILALSVDLRVTDVNSHFVKMFGYSQDPKEVIGNDVMQDLGDFIQRVFAEPEKQNARIEDLMKNPRLVLAEEIPLKDGRTVERDFAPVYYQGNYVATLWIYRDITQKKLQEVSLDEALKKAQAATVIKDQFLANMSHEIRTPLNGIIGLSGLLLESGLNLEQKDLTENIQHAGESLLEIVNDILDYSKIEAQKMEIDAEPFSIHECLEQSLYLLDYRASQKGINLSYAVNSRLPGLVLGDSGRVKQILINLISNAVKFTPAGGVLVSVSNKKMPDDYNMIQFSVKDSGIGIPANRVGHLFQSFTQVDASTSRKYGGTGLGLAISKRLCEMMGGNIWVESVEGQGSTFHFTVLAKSASGTTLAESKPELPQKNRFAEASHEKSSLKILVVEDNAVNLKLTLNLLRKFGFSADIAGNGVEAVAAVTKFTYDLIFMDVQMPEMSGLEATERIRTMNFPKGQPKIIALTANAMKEDQDRCLASGMDDYLSKPVKPQLLLEKIEKWTRATDFEGLLQNILEESFMGDFTMFEDVAHLVLRERNHTLANLKIALERQDRGQLKTAAHKLKGTVSYFHVKECLRIAQDLEARSADISFTEVEILLNQLEVHLQQMMMDLEQMLQLKTRKSA